MHLVEASAQSVPVVVTQSLGLAALAWAGLRLKGATFSKERTLLATALTVLVLSGQAVNISVSATYSGHFMGATLLTLLLGPATALLSMASVLGIQALAFGDGSITTLGANFLAIGVVPTAVTAGVMKLLKHQKQAVTAGLASLVSVIAGALTLAIIMGNSHLEMVSNHGIIGVLEMAMTLGMLALFAFAKKSEEATIQLKPIVAAIFVFTCALPFSSSLPDGLEVIIAEEDAS